MESRIILPTRSRRYGVGKEIGGAVYVHRAYERVLGAPVAEAKVWIPAEFPYVVVKLNGRTGAVTFLASPDFDTSPEPLMGDHWIVPPDRLPRLVRQCADPYIYHHKWLMVRDDYPGFDVEESKRRSARWLGLPDVDKSRVGRWSYWSAYVLPRLTDGGS